MAKIYILEDPRDNSIKYVGQTVQSLAKRLNASLCEKTKSKKVSWIKSLKNKGLKPIIKEIAEVPENELNSWECFYISFFRNIGCSLVNGTDGGDGIKNPSEYTRKLMSNAKIGHTPWNKGKNHPNAKFSVEARQSANKRAKDSRKLSNEDVKYIRENAIIVPRGSHNGNFTALAKQFNVDVKTIVKIIKRISYKEII